MTQAKVDAPTKKAARLTQKPKANKRRKKNSPPPLILTDRERVDLLLDEALRGTFPASDPVAIWCDPIQQENGRNTPPKRR
jgi:hypothetical protein